MGKFISGIAHLGGVAVYISAILIHIWTAIIAYNYSGTFFGILSFFTPFFSEIYWLFVSWNIDKFESPYIQWVIVLVVSWVLVILLSMFSGYLSNREQIAASHANDHGVEIPYYYGFGGWLIPLAIGLILVCWNSLYYIFDFLYPFTLNDLGDYVAYDRIWGVIIFAEWAYHAGSVAFILVTGYFCYKQRKYFKSAVIYFLIFYLAMSIILYYVYLTTPETAEGSSESLGNIFSSSFYAAIWWPYILKSKRVNNTYIH